MTPIILCRPASPPRCALALAALLVAGTAAPPAVRAVTYTWDGGLSHGNSTTNNLWSMANNWVGGAPPVSNIDTDLVFTHSGNRTTANQDIASNFVLHSLLFDANNDNFTTLSGNRLEFRNNPLGTGPTLTQSSAVAVTVNNALMLTNSVAVGGNGAGSLTLAGELGGAGALTKTGTGTVVLTGNSAPYNAGVTVNGGTLAIGSGGALGGSTVAVNAGGTFNVSGGTLGAASSTANIALAGTASSPATVNLSAGTITGDVTNIGSGDNGVGVFNQTGGTLNGGSIQVSNRPGSTGTYNLSSGTLTTNQSYVGNAASSGNGTFNQSGGTHTASAVLMLARLSGGGTYNLSGGTLSTGETDIGSDGGTAVFNQTGGLHIIPGYGMFMGGRVASVSSTYHLTGGTLQLNFIQGGQGTSTFNFNGGTLKAGADNSTFITTLTSANVQTGGAKIDTNGHAITIAQNLVHDPAGGAPPIDGGLTKLGSGTLTLTGTNTYTGGTTVAGGTLSVSSDANLGAASGAVTLLNGSGLVFTSSFVTGRTYNLNTGTVNFNGSNLSGATVNGGFLSGNATSSGATFNGATTLLGSSVAVAPSGATFNFATIRGGVSVTAPSTTVAFNNVFATGSSTLTVGNSSVQQGATYRVNTTGTELQGVTTIYNGGTIANSGTNLYLTGGSRTTINSGSTLSTTSGTSIELNGSLLTNNGTQSGTLNVNFGSLAKGNGTFGTVNVGDGGKFSPGNSPGIATAAAFTLGSGGRYDFELNAANYTPGDGHADLLQVTGALNVNAGTTPNSVFTVGVFSLNSANTFGAALTDFDPSRPYSFLLATAGSIVGFNANEFTVDTSGFLNNTQGGSFVVVQQGNNLVLQFSPVPEPSTWVMIGGGVLTLLALTRRRRGRGEV